MSQPYSYQPNVNRSVTRKWAEARQVDYGGDDWGDDDDDDDGYDEPAYPPLSQGRRSFTNPPPLNTSHRLSFDRGQEQRVFSASAAQPQQGLPPHQNAPPGDPRFYSQQPAAEPSGRTSIDAFRRDGPRPESRDSNTSARQFPPRKASLGHGDFPDYARSQPAPPVPAPAPQESDPAPRFITPAEIYRRHAEEERKRSQESSRPSMDSIAKDASDRTPKQSIDIDSNRRRQPTLDTVAERRSEYLESPVASPIMPTSHESQQHAAPSQIQRIDTDLPARFPSASSRYTDRPDPISASTAESPFPSRNASQTDPHAPPLPPPSPPPQVGGLPVITRGSSFGSSFFAGDSAADSHTSPHQPDHPPPVPDKDAGESSLQHRPSHGYRTMVTDAFQSENQKLGSPAPTDNSMHRSNTTSTSEISPIFGRSQEPDWDSALAENAKRVNDHDASQGELSHGDFTPPRRLGTNRRDSPSPARRPLSMEAPSIPEPQSAVSMSQDSPAATQDIAREAQLRRPGPAVLVHSRGNSRESLRGEGSGTSHKVSIPSLRNQQSYMSELSERSNQRTASEEWANWSAAQREAHARHGIQDSNPATPGLEPSGMSSPAPQSESLEKNVQSTGPASNEDMKPSAAVSGLPSQRPHMARDESFRPVLPGGWQSSASIQKAATPEPSSMLRPRPGFVNPATRNESTESIPTATAPRSANWRSEYTGVQAQAFAAATAAGDALAGIFNGPSLTSRGGDSEVSSINETDDESASTRQDPTLFTRDFAASTPEQERPAYSDSSAARDFASTRPETSDASQVTPKAHQGPFTGAEKPAPLSTSHPGLKRTGTDSVHADSPTKESERWWSDEEEEAPTAPAPLRTSRMSTIEPTRPPIPHSDSDEPDADQLHSDIVQSLTPKSSNIVPTSIANPGRVSPLRHENQRPTSPPFAAAALAVSPARALQEQNSWGPLAPHSKTVSPDRENLPVLAKAPTQAELTDSDSEQPASTTQPEKDQLSDVVTPSTGLETTRGLNGTPHPQESAPSAPNSFTIGNDLPTLPQIPTATEPEPARSSSVASSEISAPSPIEPPATTVNKPASAHDDEYRLSDTMPFQDRADRALAKDLPKPITATNGTAERSSTPTRTQDAPSPVTPRSMNAARPSFAYDSSRAYPRDKVPFEQIKSMGSAQQRIKAYNDNRDVYTQPVGQLENWLTFMNTPEHADAFAAKPISSASSVSPRPRYQQRDSTGAPSGAKQIQEDGKKLLASASKYGAKAGVLGKGLFSKGKEKFRTASAGQKVAR
ncbi:hypothetical protein OHC33_008480 [Knufia fluminis]|uniref:Uncharacterized protein n=1 Tax=Knufia fluminis TaxID=191047 RepID=A0AAN8I231_9EURO|nr:hypothetical protein OHC33_008480 [Knufia fluminis]